jgi:hypothetical protein
MPVAEIALRALTTDYEVQVDATITSKGQGKPTERLQLGGSGNELSRIVQLEDGDSIKVDITLLGIRKLNPEQLSVSIEPNT